MALTCSCRCARSICDALRAAEALGWRPRAAARSSAAAVNASLRSRPPPTAPRPSARYTRGSSNAGRIGLLDLIERQRPARHAVRELFERAGNLADAARGYSVDRWRSG